MWCSECLANPACGWCDEGSLTGLGKCHEGGAKGPLLRKKSKVIPPLPPSTEYSTVQTTSA